jgi:hypothetical protein
MAHVTVTTCYLHVVFSTFIALFRRRLQRQNSTTTLKRHYTLAPGQNSLVSLIPHTSDDRAQPASLLLGPVACIASSAQAVLPPLLLLLLLLLILLECPLQRNRLAQALLPGPAPMYQV